MDIKTPKWILDRNAELEEETKKWQKEHGDFFTFPEGETKIEIDMQLSPQKIKTKFGSVQWQYKAKVNGESKTIGVNIMLDRQIISALMRNLNPMVIIRVGKEKDNTRYSVKGLE